jgi:3-oxoacyl-[acyl-carrier protein] reductase
MNGERRILLTGVGADGQVGEVVARTFADRGDMVLLVDRSGGAERHATALRAAGARASAYRCDLSDPAAVDALADEVRREHGAIDALVHMAGGFASDGAVADTSIDLWKRVMTRNLDTAFFTARAFIPLLRERRGSIVLFASEATLPTTRIGGIGAYAIAKSGVATLARAIAQEEAAGGIRANAVAPGAIRTASNERSMGSDARYIERDEVAEAVYFLCSSAASGITGQVIRLS